MRLFVLFLAFVASLHALTINKTISNIDQDNNSNIGISSAAPTAKLSINGAVNFSSGTSQGQFQINGTSATDASISLAIIGSSAGITAPSGRFLVASGTVCNNWIAADPNGNYPVLVDSTPVAIHTNFVTIDNAQLNLTKAKIIRITAFVFQTSNGDQTLGETRLLLRKTGSGIASPPILFDNIGSTGTPQVQIFNTVDVPVDANEDFDFSCRPVTALEATHECKLWLMGYCE